MDFEMDFEWILKSIQLLHNAHLPWSFWRHFIRINVKIFFWHQNQLVVLLPQTFPSPLIFCRSSLVLSLCLGPRGNMQPTWSWQQWPRQSAHTRRQEACAEKSREWRKLKTRNQNCRQYPHGNMQLWLIHTVHNNDSFGCLCPTVPTGKPPTSKHVGEATQCRRDRSRLHRDGKSLQRMPR